MFRFLIMMAVLLAAPVYPQSPAADSPEQWVYKHTKDAITDKESDEFGLKGKYVDDEGEVHDTVPLLGVHCSNGKLDAVAIETGVVLETRQNAVFFGAMVSTVTTITIRVDDGKARTDNLADVFADSKTLIFKNGNHNFDHRTKLPVFLLKKLVVGVEGEGDRQVEMEFDMPPDTSQIQKYCGTK